MTAPLNLGWKTSAFSVGWAQVGEGGAPPPPPPPPPPDNTWKGQKMMAVNANPALDYNTTSPCRNLAKGAMRKFNSAVYNDVTDVTLNTSGANKGYPVDGTAVFGTVFLSSMVPAQAGAYKLRVKGNNPFLQAGSGSLSASTYDAVNDWTTATLTVTNPGSGDIVALQWHNVVNFGDLWVMQPGFDPGDTNLLTPAALAHYSVFNRVRVMDRVVTNENFQTDWAGSNLENEWGAGYCNSLRGAVDFAQAIGATLCVNVPTLFTYSAKVALMQAIASLIPSGPVEIEWSNEPWNFGFGQYWKIMENVFDDAQIACGINSGSMRTDRRILSCNRSGTTVTITLNFDPRTVVSGFGVGSQVYDHCDFSQGIAEGMRTLTAFSFSAGTATLQYTHPVSGNNTGSIKTDWFDSFLYLNPSNNLCAPPVCLTLPDWAKYADPVGLKVRWEMKRGLRELYDAAGVAGIQSRAVIKKGVQFEGGITYERLGYAYSVDNYGGMSWLTGNGGGLTPACYMRPLDGNVGGMTTADAVFVELEARREDDKAYASGWINFAKSWDQLTLTAYEGGPHNDKKPNQTVADAVQAAHKDDRMRVLIKNQIQDWTDRGGSAFYYFSAGSTRTFNGVIPPFSNNNTWSTTEGSLADAPTAPKYMALAQLSAATFGRNQVAGVNSGTIRFGDVNVAWGDFGTPGNGQISMSPTTKAPRVGVTYEAAASGNYSVALKCGSTAGGSDSATLYVNGVAQGASAPMTSWGNSATVPTGTCLTRTVALTKGPNFISVDVGASPRNGYVSLANVVVTPL